jgi:hypothetical protein
LQEPVFDDWLPGLIWESLKYLAKANDVADFANSEGWIVKLPIAYQHLCPAMVFKQKQSR